MQIRLLKEALIKKYTQTQPKGQIRQRTIEDTLPEALPLLCPPTLNLFEIRMPLNKIQNLLHNFPSGAQHHHVFFVPEAENGIRLIAWDAEEALPMALLALKHFHLPHSDILTDHLIKICIKDSLAAVNFLSQLELLFKNKSSINEAELMPYLPRFKSDELFPFLDHYSQKRLNDCLRLLPLFENEDAERLYHSLRQHLQRLYFLYQVTKDNRASLIQILKEPTRLQKDRIKNQARIRTLISENLSEGAKKRFQQVFKNDFYLNKMLNHLVRWNQKQLQSALESLGLLDPRRGSKRTWPDFLIQSLPQEFKRSI